jgi:hypothetical protein
VTVGHPKQATIAAQLIRSGKSGGNRLLLRRVNLALRTMIKSDISPDRFYDAAAGLHPDIVHGSLSARG